MKGDEVTYMIQLKMPMIDIPEITADKIAVNKRDTEKITLNQEKLEMIKGIKWNNSLESIGGIPIIMEAIIGLVTIFDIKADVLVSLALIASVLIHEDFAAGEVAFIMQLGALLEDLTVAKARAGIAKLVHLTPQTARILADGILIPASHSRGLSIQHRFSAVPSQRWSPDRILLP